MEAGIRRLHRTRGRTGIRSERWVLVVHENWASLLRRSLALKTLARETLAAVGALSSPGSCSLPEASTKGGFP